MGKPEKQKYIVVNKQVCVRRLSPMSVYWEWKNPPKRNMAYLGQPPFSFFYSRLFSILFLPDLRKAGCLLSHVSFSSPLWYLWLWERSLFPLLFSFLDSCSIQYLLLHLLHFLLTAKILSERAPGTWSFLLNRLAFSHQWSIMGKVFHPHSTQTLSRSGFSSPPGLHVVPVTWG